MPFAGLMARFRHITPISVFCLNSVKPRVIVFLFHDAHHPQHLGLHRACDLHGLTAGRSLRTCGRRIYELPITPDKLTYSLTEKSIDLLPLFVEAIGWSAKYLPVNCEKYKPALELRAAGPAALEGLRQKLLQEHVTHAAGASQLLP